MLAGAANNLPTVLENQIGPGGSDLLKSQICTFESVDHMDNVLLPYLTAENEREREQHLDELLTRDAAPLIRQVLRRKFGFYVNGQGINKNNQDADRKSVV